MGEIFIEVFFVQIHSNPPLNLALVLNEQIFNNIREQSLFIWYWIIILLDSPILNDEIFEIR